MTVKNINNLGIYFSIYWYLFNWQFCVCVYI